MIVYRCDDTSNLPTVRYLASDRGIDGRVGGKRLCEVIGFTRVSAFSANLRALAKGYVLTWDEQPDASVKFVPDAVTKGKSYTFVEDVGGLRLISTGFMIFMK